MACVVGSGGAGGIAGAPPVALPGTASSVASIYFAAGGGTGATYTRDGGYGGSGGGGSQSTTALGGSGIDGQGFRGATVFPVTVLAGAALVRLRLMRLRQTWLLPGVQASRRLLRGLRSLVRVAAAAALVHRALVAQEVAVRDQTPMDQQERLTQAPVAAEVVVLVELVAQVDQES